MKKTVHSKPIDTPESAVVAAAMVACLVASTAQHEDDIVKLESDVRSIQEQQARLVKVVEKTATVLTELDKTTAELKVMVQTSHRD